MIPLQPYLLAATTAYQLIASWNEDRQFPPGQLIDMGGSTLHLYAMGQGSPTVVLDHSLGGIEGYLLIQKISKITRVCIYDRAGYGWSESSSNPRTSEQIVSELDSLLERAKIEPPYLLIGDSFGSYNVRLYTHRYPEKVMGMILTDGLHEVGMLNMPLPVKVLKFFFMSGFLMSTLGAALGILRLLRNLGAFELIKPELRRIDPTTLNLVKRSFCRPKHWVTMFREMLDLDTSSRQLQAANDFGTLPIVLITASSFFRPSLWTLGLPIRAVELLRDKMHAELLNLSADCVRLQAEQSSHFVWIDRPEAILNAIEIILRKGDFRNISVVDR
ncbi:MAG TPA: alpha/beta hydrolase [Oscillatoriales cyanobacterium M59_W2019_021]|nr:alpha/beta hydrolase [Oscillatoriales cyanobacterium M4454_W2019_049]HIK52651.1 alpha/beta hydrolase [Oscillatoriales cyanobacterium M59_W2019_021]